MISEMKKYVKFQDYGIRKTYCPFMGPILENVLGSTPMSALSQDTYLTNKYNHFKKTGGCITTNNN